MGDPAAWMRRAASPAALGSLLVVLLLGVGVASALARRSPAEDVAGAPVTVATVAPVSSAAPPGTPAAAAVTATEATSAARTPEPTEAPPASLALSPTTASPSPSATPPTSSPTAQAAASAPPTPASTIASPATAVATPAPVPAPPPATAAAPIIQAPSSVGVGEAFGLHVIASGAASVSIEVNGNTYSAAPSGERFWLLIGVPVGADTGPRTIRAITRNASGAILGASVAPLEFTPVERPVDYLQLTEEQSSVLTEEAGRTELALRASQFAQFDSQRRWTGRFLRPLLGAQTTAFGQGRSINGGPVGGFHSGTDIAANLGEPVRASAAGRVAWVGEMPIRGRSVLLDHGAGVKSGYHHLDQIYVEVGALLEAGQLVGAAGATGLATGPHLHWEVSVWGVNVDPLQWTTAGFEP